MYLFRCYFVQMSTYLLKNLMFISPSLFLSHYKNMIGYFINSQY